MSCLPINSRRQWNCHWKSTATKCPTLEPNVTPSTLWAAKQWSLSWWLWPSFLLIIVVYCCFFASNKQKKKTGEKQGRTRRCLAKEAVFASGFKVGAGKSSRLRTDLPPLSPLPLHFWWQACVLPFYSFSSPLPFQSVLVTESTMSEHWKLYTHQHLFH